MMQMIFHSKTMNTERKNHNIKRVPKPENVYNPNLSASNNIFTGSSMITRVNNANSGCKHCGK